MVAKNSERKLYGNFKKLQDIYNDKGLRSIEFYNQNIAYVKRLLNKYLYQKQFNEDNINDCFVLLYEKIARNYDPNKGCLGTFIYTIIRNYCTKINYRLVNYQSPISLDFEYINREDLNRSYFDIFEEKEEELEEEYDFDNVENYCKSLQCEDTLDRIEYYCDILKQYENIPELSSRDIEKLNKLDAVKRDLLWSVWKQSRQY